MVKRLITKLLYIFVCCSLLANAAHADEKPFPDVWLMPSYIYDDYLTAYDRMFDEEAVPYWWAVGLSTAALIAVDDKLISDAEHLGKKWNISSKDNTTTAVKYKNLNILRVPTDLGSWLYFIGDGWTHSAIALGFVGVGSWMDDDKTYNVGFELIEGMLTTTIATQALKHITGHETPNEATTPTGKWDFFPNQQDYRNNVAKYDAFPSGHLAVGSMTLTVLHKNYPDNPWIMPVGVTLLSALSFQMMNNGVHWVSDYPLAIALGYTFGNIAYERGQRSLERSNAKGQSTEWIPLLGQDYVGLGVQYKF
ncbi:MAG: phosphatase PAP2 family protein [Ghiorsea sp.]